ncbi:MAG: EAL domain-containing protein, partial [Lachnospiraceae bacterium]|nr:EAL domain-containing protein [Lachnospiraceae bacterium]
VMSLFKSDSKNGYLHTTADSVENIYGYQKLSTMDWIYIIRQPGTQYKKVLSAYPFMLIVVLTVILVIAFMLSTSLTHKYTAPVYSLKKNMKEAAEGNLDVRCEIDSDDEFGQLSDSFNSMMSIISNNYEELNEAKNILEANEIELKKNYHHIEQLAYHDGLTGLYNRVAFMKYAYDIFHEDENQFKMHSIFFIDLDNFKNVNDTLGHDYGDMLLKQVATHLTKCISDEDILARTGGDEFLILKKTVENNEDLEFFAKRLIDIVKEPFYLDNETAHVSMSVGIATFPTNGLSITELIKNADIAMYNAKTSGKNGYCFFNSYMEDDVNKRNELAEVLTTVIEKGEVYLQYQPQVNVSTGRITGYEALMRIESDLLGFIPPTEFIPIAEDTGMINELGDWALYEACSFNQKLIESGFKDMRVSVNISTAQLKDNKLISTISSIPEKTGMSLDHLEIEITESVLMDSFEHNLTLINDMKRLGATIALDDFGTGYSSFNYLTQIPIDTLKIDKSFIQGICNNQKDRYIADSIISLAHKMNITVVAEGVEDVEQLTILQNQFCDTLQGYLFSKPLNANDFIELATENKKKTS